MTGMTEAGAGWDGGMLSASARGRDGTSGDWAPSRFQQRRRSVCSACGSLRSTTKVSGGGARRALKEPAVGSAEAASRLAGSREDAAREETCAQSRVRAASVSPSAS